MPPKWEFSLICDPSKKSDSVTFVPLWCPNLLQKIRKILKAASEKFKDGLTDGPKMESNKQFIVLHQSPINRLLDSLFVKEDGNILDYTYPLLFCLNSTLILVQLEMERFLKGS